MIATVWIGGEGYKMDLDRMLARGGAAARPPRARAAAPPRAAPRGPVPPDARVIEVVVDSRIRIRGPLPSEVLSRLRAEFEHPNPQWRDRPEEPRVYATWGEDPDGVPTFPRGGQDRVRAALGGIPSRWVDRRVRGRPLHRVLEHRVELWEHQRVLFDAIVEHETTLVRSATGSGKTSVALAFVAWAGVPVLVVVHTQALADQWVQRAGTELGLDADEVGFVGDGERRILSLTIALHQTLARPGALTPEITDYFGAVIVDETQRAAAKTVFDAVDPMPARYRVLISADETRKDRKEFLIYDLGGPIRAEVTREACVSAGKILDVEVRVVPTPFQAPWYLAAMRRPPRYPREKMVVQSRLVEAACASPERNELIVAAAVAEVEAGEQVIVLSRRVEHCNALDREFVARAVPAGFFLGGKANQRMFAITREGMASGAIRVGVGTVEALGTGIDLPAVAVGVVAATLGSNRQLLGQVAGRVCRVREGKASARLYYLWDRHVNPTHLANICEWFPSVSLLAADGWVDARAALEGMDSIDFDAGGIIGRLRGDPRRRTKMRSRKPVDQAEVVESPKLSADLFNEGQTTAGLSADASALHIALKARGASPGLVVVQGWDPAQRTSAAAWALGKLGERPTHLSFDKPPPPARLSLEEDLSVLAQRLLMMGVDVKLTHLAAWSPAQRAEAARWCEGADMPAFLRGASGSGSGSKAEVDVKPGVARRDTYALGEGVQDLESPSTITFTWAEEKYCLAVNSFTSCGVGPFSVTAPVRPGETIAAAYERVGEEVRASAERERDAKIASHRAKLVEAGILKGSK